MELLWSILDYAIESKASDLHISEGEPIAIRVDGVIKKFEQSVDIDNGKIKEILFVLVNKNNTLAKKFLENQDIDFAFLYKEKISFRVNGFYKLGKMAFVLRRISSEVKSMSDLGLPSSVEKFTRAKQGLILVTGPTGSGKSTSMVSMLNEINKTRKEHIITIEDPVEYIFHDDQSIFSQREVGNDTESFSNALRASLREDPDIIMVGEMRDRDTVEAALELAETGHLVFSTLHTSGSIQTITRLLSFFPSDLQESVQHKLGDVLFGVLSQRLIPRADGNGRIGIFEVMMTTPAIRNLISAGDLIQVASHIETGHKDGMIQMKRYADIMKNKGIIKEEDYINYFKDDMTLGGNG